MEAFKQLPMSENRIELNKQFNETLAGISDCARIICYLEAYRWRSEVEESHLRAAKQSLYALNGMKQDIFFHFRKFLN
jgi:tRNA (Thr-GGU) A37 N-methylase